jgi:hypothetical protein
MSPYVLSNRLKSTILQNMRCDRIFCTPAFIRSECPISINSTGG